MAITDARLSPRYQRFTSTKPSRGRSRTCFERTRDPASARRAAVEPALRMGNILDFRFGNFEIDAARHELRRAGEAVHIEPQVFDLLVHLVQNRDRIVSKDELIETIWRGRTISEAAL